MCGGKVSCGFPGPHQATCCHEDGAVRAEPPGGLPQLTPLAPSPAPGPLCSPLKLWASVGHWLVWHFDLSKYTEAQQTRVKIRWVSGESLGWARVAGPALRF